jgi:UbiD family decarboxylase
MAMSFEQHIDELTVASTLHEKFYGVPLPVVELANGIPVPANAEYAMTAEIMLDDDIEGPYVDITGTIDDERMEPVFKINSIHHRNNPIFHALIPAEAEHKALMGLPRAPTIKSAVSNVALCHDVHMTEGGCGWLSAVVSITPNGPDDGQKAIIAALEGHRSMKMVTIVNQDIDVTDSVRVEWAMMTRWQPDLDTIILSGQKGSSLDPSRGDDGMTSKIGYDATLSPGVDMRPFTSVQ